MKRTKLIFFACCAFFLCSSGNLFAKQETEVKRVEDIYIRDPYILPVEKEQMYYMYRSASVTNEHGKTVGGVQVFKSKDLKNWTGPVQVCELPETNWSSGLIWAPGDSRFLPEFLELPSPNVIFFDFSAPLGRHCGRLYLSPKRFCIVV